MSTNLEANEEELRQLGTALLHMLNRPGRAFVVVMVDRDHPDRRRSYTCMASAGAPVRAKLAADDADLRQLGTALLHVLRHPGTAFEVTRLDNEDPDSRHLFTVMASAREPQGKEARTHERH